MLLFDRIRGKAPEKRTPDERVLNKIIADAKVFQVDEVVEYALALNEGKVLQAEKFWPRVAPLYNAMWFEWSSDANGYAAAAFPGVAWQTGVFVSTVKWDGMTPLASLGFQGVPSYDPACKPWWLMRGTHVVWRADRDSPGTGKAEWYVSLDSKGHLMPSGCFAAGDDGESLKMCDWSRSVVLMSLAHTHSTNRRIHQMAPALPEQQKRLRAKKPPLVTYGTIEVPGWRAVLAEATRRGITRDQLKIHTVGGYWWGKHTRDETEQRWIEPYSRGRYEDGVHLSTYEVKHRKEAAP